MIGRVHKVLHKALLRRGLWPESGVVNPCLGPLPDALARDERLQCIWDGLDAEQVWDSHAHLTGVGDSNSGIRLHRDMTNPLKPLTYLQRVFFLNASCSNEGEQEGEGVDDRFVARLLALHDSLPRGYKTVLLAFDDSHDEQGRRRGDLSAFVTPNAYAQRLARDYPHRLEWIASIHPYREDCVEALEEAVAGGARAIKWLPPAQGMDPASPQCDRFYDALARHGLPLLSHAGGERAVHGSNRPDYGNPLRLRRALERCVRVIVAHCASMGRYTDTDQGANGPTRTSFELFARMMDERAHEGLLLADISAITQINRAGVPLRTVIERDDWHHRLLNGTDYPLPGVMPLFSLHKLAADGYLAEGDIPLLIAVRRHNPLLFDIALKRRLRWQGKAIADGVFESRRHLEPTASIPLH
ncbi:MAG: amidohydrolase family protein [Thiobacillus sp.]|nr:amidohydrolase family protein [Thiobacillus sp.]